MGPVNLFMVCPNPRMVTASYGQFSSIQFNAMHLYSAKSQHSLSQGTKNNLKKSGDCAE